MPNRSYSLTVLSMILWMDVVFLDFAKAFDRVGQNILLQKCVIFVSPGLFEREQRVVIEGINSTRCAIPSYWVLDPL